MTDQTAAEVDQLFASAFFNALVGAITEASGSPWQVAAAGGADLSAVEGEPVRMKLTLGGSLQGEIRLEVPPAQALLLAAKLLKQPAKKFGAKQSDALVKLIDAGAKEFCSEFEKNCGVFTIETSSSVEEASESSNDLASAARFSATDDGTGSVSLVMYLSPSLTESLALHYKGEEDSEPGSVDNIEGVAESDLKLVPEQVNLELVLDVELNVTLRFGQRQLTLREVLELTSGSVIELDRQVEEPVELLLEGKVIARGEAVVIDGNYGLRVTEVPQVMSSVVLR